MGGLMEFAGDGRGSLVGGKLGETLPLNKNENAELNIFLPTSDAFGTAATVLNIAAPILGLIPQFAVHGTPLGVGGEAGFGGDQLSKAAKYGAEGAKMISDAFKGSAERARRWPATTGGPRTTCSRPTSRPASSSSTGGRSSRRCCASRSPSASTSTTRSRSSRPRRRRSSCAPSSPTRTCTRGCRASCRRPSTTPTSSRSTSRRGPSTLKREVMRPEFDDQDIIKFGYWNDGSGACSPARRSPSTSSGWRWPTSRRTSANTS